MDIAIHKISDTTSVIEYRNINVVALNVNGSTKHFFSPQNELETFNYISKLKSK